MLTIIQVVAAVAGVGYAVPQVYKLARSGTAAGVSLSAWQIMAATTGSWLLHGIWEHAPELIVANAAGVAAGVLMTWAICRERRLSIPRHAVFPLLLFAACVAVRLVAGPAAFGAFVVVPQVICMSGQGFELIRSVDLRGVSAIFLWYGVALQALWATYGFLRPDPANAIAATITGSLCAFNVVWFLLRTHHVVRAHPGFARRTLADELDPEPPAMAEVDPVG